MRPKPWMKDVPMYEPGRPLEEVARDLGLPDVSALIKTASNENELGPSPLAIEAMTKAAAHMHRYPDGACFYLKQKLAESLAVSPAQILLGNGSNEIIELLGHVYLEPGSGLLMSETAFVVYRLICALFHAPCVQVPMRNFTHDLVAMSKVVTPETRMAVICNPNNPTGTSVDPQELHVWLDSMPEDILLVIDEAYVELMPPGLQPDILARIRAGQRNLVLLRTFSKAYGLAGLRIGYAVAHPDIIEGLNRARQPFNVNAMAQAAAYAALDDTQHLARSRTLTTEGLAFFETLLQEHNIPFVPSTANFILIQTGEGREVCRKLLAKHVIARPMDGYGLPAWIRLTIGTPQQNQRIASALLAALGRESE